MIKGCSIEIQAPFTIYWRLKGYIAANVKDLFLSSVRFIKGICVYFFIKSTAFVVKQTRVNIQNENHFRHKP